MKGFCDSLPIFKEKFPDRKAQKKSFSQPDLVIDFLNPGDIQLAHNAKTDVEMLQKLLETTNVDKNTMLNHTNSLDFMLNKKEREKRIKLCKTSLDKLNISSFSKNKISKAIIDLNLLKETAKKGYQGLEILLAENVNGKPRVTNSKKVLRQLFEELNTLLGQCSEIE